MSAPTDPNADRRFDLMFTVPGVAAPQGSKTHVGGGRMRESSRAVKPWRVEVAWAAASVVRQSGWTLARTAVTLEIDFVMPRPKATPKSSTPHAIKRPDIDKLARAILDGITHVLIEDDSLVVDLHCTKRLAELHEAPHTRIRIVAL